MSEKMPQAKERWKKMDALFNVLVIAATVVLAISGIFGLLSLKSPAIWIFCGSLVLYSFTLCVYLQGYVWKQEVEEVTKKEESAKQQAESTRKMIAEIGEAYEAKNQVLLKQLADRITSNPESVKTVIESTKNNPATANAVMKAVIVSPKLEEAIKQVAPNSKLLPEDKTISKGTLIKKGANGSCLFDFSISPNTSINLSSETGNTPGTGYNYSIGQPIPAEARIVGNLGAKPAIINGRKYEELYFEGNLEFNADPLMVPDSKNFPVTLTGRFTFEGTLRGYLSTPMIDNLPQPKEPVFNYRLHGKGIVIIEFYRKYESSLEFSRVTYRFE